MYLSISYLIPIVATAPIYTRIYRFQVTIQLPNSSLEVKSARRIYKVAKIFVNEPAGWTQWGSRSAL
jgi:hypothetical protein